MYLADCQTMVTSMFQSNFCQFGVMQGAADLGGSALIFCQNRLIQVWKSMLKHRTHSWLYKSSRLKVDFCIQLLVKFQILIHFLWQMLDFCLGCSNKKCWVWFLALIFLLLTFLFFWGNPYEAIQPVKMTIFSCRKITFEQELASYWPVLLHNSWIFDSGTLTQIVSADISAKNLMLATNSLHQTIF